MKIHTDVYGSELHVGDYVVKSANNTPRYAIILDFPVQHVTRAHMPDYDIEHVRIVSDYSNVQGDTFGDRLLQLSAAQVPVGVQKKLMDKLNSYVRTGHVRIQDTK